MAAAAAEDSALSAAAAAATDLTTIEQQPQTATQQTEQAVSLRNPPALREAEPPVLHGAHLISGLVAAADSIERRQRAVAMFTRQSDRTACGS